MKERPILFSAPTVRAILDGTKTQTRRVVKPQPLAEMYGVDLSKWGPQECAEYGHPYGIVGDRLWVRETFKWAAGDSMALYECSRVLYRADPPWGEDSYEKGWSPSIFMPREYSRITLEITDVRVERVASITEADCRAEGCSGGHDSIPGYDFSATPQEHYCHLWDSLNAKRGYGWDVNPWVWVLTFKTVDA